MTSYNELSKTCTTQANFGECVVLVMIDTIPFATWHAYCQETYVGLTESCHVHDPQLSAACHQH